ncbi:chorismate-binding protein [Actinotalea ferrariae]|uniref:isochorismate synthase n=1 Tax=Actinotalea ferrariae TaxID=1386098 RepID=UPI001C8C1745|nr:isochorismate synthase [Actinotalea ferrariae]MBX9243260.1 chorismate-binding protein [Actinotalea ferrariae]
MSPDHASAAGAPSTHPGLAPGSLPLSVPLVSRTVPVDPASLPADLLDLLPAQGGLAWVRRGDGLVAWGEVARTTTTGPERFVVAERAWRTTAAHAVVRDEVRVPGTGPVAFGTFAFAAGSAAASTLVVPRVVVGRRGRTAWITTIDAGGAPGPGRVQVTPPPSSPGEVTYAEGALDPAGWQDAVARAVQEIRAGRMEKVVLARDVVARTAEPLDPRWVLHRLAADYPSCWTFAVDGILGATPELLLRSEKGLVTSRVLAGTIRRTGDDDADLARAAILAHSSKDLEEHEYAVESLLRALEPFCSSTNVPETPFVLHLPNVLHLATDVAAVLATDGDVAPPTSLALAAALHPTAAVAGTPTEAACDLIERVEGMDRGRYAGPVGWVGVDGDGEWGIALRSAELDPADPHRLRLFAGCGIVAASAPAAELAESEAKLEPMRHALATD